MTRRTLPRSTTARVPENWRDRLPDPAAYYGQRVAKLGKPNGTGWAQGVCPFHDDHNKSLSVCIIGERGGWRCFAGCGGGDLLGFHCRLRGLDPNKQQLVWLLAHCAMDTNLKRFTPMPMPLAAQLTGASAASIRIPATSG